MNKKETTMLGMYVIAHFAVKKDEPYFLTSGGTFTTDALSRSVMVFTGRRDADLKMAEMKERISQSRVSDYLGPIEKTLQVMQIGIRRA